MEGKFTYLLRSDNIDLADDFFKQLCNYALLLKFRSDLLVSSKITRYRITALH